MESNDEHDSPGADNGTQSNPDDEGRSVEKENEVDNDSSPKTDNNGTKRSSDSESGSAQKRSRIGGDTEIRLLIPSWVARAIIGKGGHNITKLRNEYKGYITVPDCPGPERIISISSDQYTAVQVVNEIIPNMEDNSSRSSRSDDVELRLLVHQSLAGCIIGKSGIKIQKLQEKTGARIKLFSKCCPQSTDRVCLVSGRPSACIETLKEILDLLKASPIKGPNTPYDPLNFDAYLSQEYGGFSEQDSKSRSSNLKRSEFEDSVGSINDNFAIKRDADSDLGPPQKRARVGGDTEIRLLIPSKVARGIIGRGGNNIKRLRAEYKGFITVPDSPGPERVLTISSDFHTAIQVVSDVIPYVEEASSRSGSRSDDVELRILVHQSQAGCIIGKSGIRIQKLEEMTGARIKLFSKCCPMSTDRVCQVWGRPKACVKAIKEIFDLMRNSPVKGTSTPYDPRNFDQNTIEDYGGYREQEKVVGKSHEEGKIEGESDRGSPHKQNNDPLHLLDDDSGVKQDGEGEKESIQRFSRREGDLDVRLLIPSKVARAIIGKGGHNITKLRTEYRALITVRDCRGPERIFSISSELDTIQQILNSALPLLEEGSGDDFVDLRLLVHRSQVGCIIGKSGSKIQNLQEKTGARIKIFSKCCPQSTDRVCQIAGKGKSTVECLREIVELMESSPIKGTNNPYDPHNFDDYSSQEYGGYSDHQSKGRGSSRSQDIGSRSSGSLSPLSRNTSRTLLGRSDESMQKVRSHDAQALMKNNEILQELVEEQEAEIQSLKKRIYLTGI
ncbi:hypothetical protein R5R35_011551 [Gryllus longicercus]|uniref:K Homology domain-containing protein n=1 Tax=Gryllus longicercus TaxID=2509291 RepID=A0AAN9VME2_9ORTH